MSWLTFSGHTPSQFPMDIHGGGSISPYLVNPHNQWAELVKTIAPAIKDYLQQKKADEVANGLMNMENPPRAEAVDPSIQGAPATRPATGGMQGYKMQKMYQDYLNQQPDTATDDENFLKLYRSNHPDEFAGDDGMTPYQREQTRLREMDIQRKMNAPAHSKADAWSNAMAVARGKLDDKGQFTNQYTGAENGPMVQLVTPSGYKMAVPWDAYQARQQPSGAQMYQSKVQGELPAPDLPPLTEPEPTTAPASPESGSTPSVKSQAEYAALPSGTIYIAPDGTKRRKP